MKNACAKCDHPKDEHEWTLMAVTPEQTFMSRCWSKDAPPMEFYCECEQFEERCDGMHETRGPGMFWKYLNDSVEADGPPYTHTLTFPDEDADPEVWLNQITVEIVDDKEEE